MRFLLVFFMMIPMHELIIPRGVTRVNQWRNNELGEYYDQVEPKLFGWSSVMIHDDVPVVYVSETLFSAANQSKDTVKYTYTHTTGSKTNVQLSVTGSLSASAAPQIKEVKTKVEASTKASASNNQSAETSTKTNMNIEVPPYRKVSLKLRGEATLSNGVGIFYVMRVPVRRGSWEVLTFVSEHFWLKEEII